jgi:hypothetical protein
MFLCSYLEVRGIVFIHRIIVQPQFYFKIAFGIMEVLFTNDQILPSSFQVVGLSKNKWKMAWVDDGHDLWRTQWLFSWHMDSLGVRDRRCLSIVLPVISVITKTLSWHLYWKTSLSISLQIFRVKDQQFWVYLSQEKYKILRNVTILTYQYWNWILRYSQKVLALAYHYSGPPSLGLCSATSLGLQNAHSPKVVKGL